MKKLLFVISILGVLCPIGRWKLAASEKSFILRPLASEPTVQTSNIVVTNLTTSSISFTVTAGNGTHQMIVMKKNSPVDVLPVDGVSYQGTFVFGTGSELGTGNFVVGIGGPDWSWSIGGLEAGVLYYIRSFALNDPLANINLTSNEANYLTSTAELNPISASTINEPRTLDSLALVALFDSTGGVNWTSKTNWKTANPIDSWYGVNISNGRVNYLDLTDNHLTGRLPSAIGDLSALVNLKLGSNIITGTIPVSIGNLTALEELYIHGNQFTGSIPSSLGNLSNLRILYLQLNYLTGSIPHEIGNLSQVQLITVSGNDLSDSIPSEIGNLTSLTALYLNGNQFSGTIPTTLGNLTGLQYLTLSDNQLTGSIPTELGALTQLQWLWLASNHLSGSIPSQIGNLTHLTQLFLDHNNFVGDVPDLSGLTNLEELRLHANRFSGLPDLSSISSLTDLIVDHNMFTFEDIESNIGAPSSTFTYSPQDSVGVYKDTTVEAGSTKEFTILVGGASNQYQWYKNGSVIGGATSASFTIPSVTYLDSGTYHCRITNTVATALTLSSRTFTLHVNVILPPTISSFSPPSGPIGTSVTITGNNFNTTASYNVVYFGAVKALVTNASSTELTVSVPTGSTYALITVTDTTTGLTAYSSKPFVVTFPSSHVIDATSFASKADFTTGAAPYTVAVGDLDGDGKPDVAVANEGSGMLSIFRNTSTIGSCNFATKVDFATGGSPRGVAIGDVDGDGNPDVVVTNNGGTTISVYRNTSTIGAITLDSKVDFAMGNGPNTVAIGDVDGDGKADLVVASEFSSGMISIFRNTGNVGTISFAAKLDSVTGDGPWGVAIGDVDGDGKPDIVNANAGNNAISVFRNTSTGGSISLDAKVDFATGSYPLGVALGDVDGDGKPDVVVTNYSGATVSVFRNTSTSGSISLDVKADFETGSVPAGVALSDMDGDGKADIATANYSSSTVSVLRNTSSSGTIDLAAKVDFATGSSPVGVAISDMDGDGKPDLAATNQGSSTVSVLLNTSTSGRTLDSLALVAFYDSTGGANWTNKTNWKSSNPIDMWHGVIVHNGRVNYLILEDNSLTGEIPKEIGNLANMTELSLNGNQLTGEIPIEIGNLTNLHGMIFRGNQLTGTIPIQIGNLVSLGILDLESNQLTGTIPHEIGNLTNLEYLSLYKNNLIDTIPPEIGNLTSLVDLKLSENQLTGLPDLSSLTSLNQLFVENNKLTFEDIEPNIGGPNVSFIYSPQDSVGTYSDVVTLPGVNLLLSVTVGGAHNQYQWMKDGIDIPGATGSEYNLLTSTGNYHCRITNTVATELTLYSRSTKVTTYPLPAAPTNLTATPVSGSRIVLNWTASPDAVKYFIYRFPPGSSFALIDSVSAPATTYTDTGLTLVTTYNYHVVTMNQFRWMSLNSSDVSATTLGITPSLGTPNVSNPSPIPGAAVTLTVTATGTSPTVKLFYGKTTQSEGDSLTMTYNGTNYSGTIPGTSVTQEGVWFRIRAQNTGGVAYYPAVDARTSISVTINDMVSIWDNSLFYGGVPEEQYYSIAMSMSGSLSLTELWGAQTLEEGVPTNWRAWEFDQITQSFDDVTSLTGDKAYFIFHRQGSAQEIFNNATSRRTNDPQMFGNLILKPGWNAVPWPHTFPANVFVTDANQDSIGSVWKLWGNSGWEQITEMRAFGGYMVYNKTGGDVRLGDVVRWTLITTKPMIDQNGWRLRLIAESGWYRDAFNFAGVSRNYSTMSEPEPLTMGKSVTLNFKHHEQDLSSDIRSDAEDGHIWDLSVLNTSGNNRAILKWDPQNFPADLNVILIDVSNNKILRLDETTHEYEFRTYRQNAFKLIAGKAEFVERETLRIKSTLPDEFSLSQNYPNPFNPSTTIKFDVARSGPVKLKVYNILGQEVATLVNGYFETGRDYSVVWNGKDALGRAVASGVYIYRLETEKIFRTKKMLLVK